ncbi:MAG TPA: hypothetical protein VGG71_13390 [Chitinophagaceae bacterium]
MASFSLLSFCFFSSAQDITGIWNGYFIADGGGQYKLEFQIKSDPSEGVTGVSYSWGSNISFYGKATMSGSYDKGGKKFQIQELRTVEVKNPLGGGTCLMKYFFTYDKSGNEEFLEGTFVGRSEDRKDPKKDGEWGDCGGGKVYLRRVQTSEFYVEPFLRDKPTPKTTASTPKKDSSAVKKPVTTSLPQTTVKKSPPKTNSSTAKKTTPVKKPNNSTVTTNKKPVSKNPSTKIKPVIIAPDSSLRKDTENKTAITPMIKNPVEKKIITPEVLRTRENELAKSITVYTNEVIIKLYDNGEIDGDSISVFVDKQLKLSHKMLTASPIILTLNFDENNDEHEVVMVAENLGRIPPNTALMLIYSGDKRYQAQITTDEQKNAVVKFKYEKPAP